MAQSPRVTICLPVYNGEDYLDKALASLSEQTFRDMEILVSDNASTDKTPEIIAKWAAKDNRIRMHRQPENLGARLNYIWLLKNTSTPWMMYAAYDDTRSPNYVQALYDKAQTHPDAQIVAAHIILQKPDGAVYKDAPFPEALNTAPRFRRVKNLLNEARSGCFYGLVRRDAFTEAWFNAERFKYLWGQDFLVLLPFLLAGTLYGTNAATFYQLDTGVSSKRYKPQTLSGEAHMYFTFLYECLRVLYYAPLTAGQKLALLPAVVVYVGHNSWKFRRLAVHTLQYPFTLLKNLLRN